VVLLMMVAAALAQEDPAALDAKGRAMRPLTYPANPDLSKGTIDNFFSVYVNPNALASTLKPKQEARDATTATLPIANRTTGWQEITVDGTKIGVIGPLTVGAIHGITAGVYVVKMTNSTGYTATTRIETTTRLPEAIVPGNAAARAALESGYLKPGLVAPILGEGRPVGYTLPSPPAVDGTGDE
jgi:hypothetical protein